MAKEQPRPTRDDLNKANAVIEALKQNYTPNLFEFTTTCSVYVSGNYNSILRRAVMYVLTNELKPATQCGLNHVAQQLHAHFQQATLFA